MLFTDNVNTRSSFNIGSFMNSDVCTVKQVKFFPNGPLLKSWHPG